jgi:hypothetical protein
MGASFLTSAPLLAYHAAADASTTSLSACRSDPILKLSNGKQLSMVVTIFDTATYVSKIAYSAYIPTGITVKSVTMTGSPFAGKESVAVYATNPANSYTTKTYVTDSHSNITVTAQTTLATFAGGAIMSRLVNGLANSAISAQVTG